jgi:hypothetical protein
VRCVEGGCRAVSLDFGAGAWRRLDSAPGPALECRELRRVPLTHLRSALGGYVARLEEALLAAHGDPRGAHSLHIEADGRTRLTGRDYMGRFLRLELPDFPLRTPLRRIDVTSVSGAAAVPAAHSAERIEPL